MKTYLPGLIAIMIGFGYSAFTKPSKNLVGDKLFRYNRIIYFQTFVQDISKWEAVDETIDCLGSANKACEVLVDQKYYHLDGSSFFVLNNHAYITSGSPAPEVGDEEMFIHTNQGGQFDKYIVVLTDTTVANQAAINNKD